MTQSAQVLGQRIADARRRTGMSLRAFAAQAAFNPNVLSRIERGDHNMTIATLFRLAHHLNVSPSILLRGLPVEEELERET
jgi:transcriptional regulator with XRE-family HTH domain